MHVYLNHSLDVTLHFFKNGVARKINDESMMNNYHEFHVSTIKFYANFIMLKISTAIFALIKCLQISVQLL